MLQRWKSVLNEAADKPGWTVDAKTSKPELIDEISSSSAYEDEGLVGVEFAIKTIESLLHKGSDGVSKVGIWGIGGVGKTTIASAIFMKILSQFEGSYFAANVREQSENNTLTHLQKELLCTILDDRDLNIEPTFIRRKLEDKKVLIVFDDVTSLEQIENMVGDFKWLSSKSQIIITTRDKCVLRNCGIDDAYIYEAKGLTCNEAHQLFNHHAFRQYSPIRNYMELSSRVIEYCEGLPVALKVLGSTLLCRSIWEWESVIKSLEIMPHSDVVKVLKVSYDDLDYEEQVIFLDIACFFHGDHIDSVIESLEACDISANLGIQVLIDKGLVSVTDNKIIMHRLVREMGKEIARYDTIRRLWHRRDILQAFKKDREIEAIRSISLDVSKIGNAIARIDLRLLSKMPNLRFFRVYNSKCPSPPKLSAKL